MVNSFGKAIASGVRKAAITENHDYGDGRPTQRDELQGTSLRHGATGCFSAQAWDSLSSAMAIRTMAMPISSAWPILKRLQPEQEIVPEPLGTDEGRDHHHGEALHDDLVDADHERSAWPRAA